MMTGASFSMMSRTVRYWQSSTPATGSKQGVRYGSKKQWTHTATSVGMDGKGVIKPKTLKRKPLTARHEPEPVTYGQGRGGRPWRRLRAQILERDGYLCQCPDCKKRPIPRVAHEVDHIRPLSQGGTDDPGNLQAMNKHCHALKSQQEAQNARGGRGGSKV